MDKSDGSIYTNKSFDREIREKYVLSILASNNPDLYINPTDAVRPSLSLGTDHGHVNVTVSILDENDNPPIFERNDYYAGINSMANVNDFVTKVVASDLDVGDNGTLHYYIAGANLYKYGSDKPSGSIIPSPFNVTQDGKLITSGYMAEYNQDRFIVDVIAKETAIPERYAMTKVHVCFVIFRTIIITPTLFKNDICNVVFIIFMRYIFFFFYFFFFYFIIVGMGIRAVAIDKGHPITTTGRSQ